MKLNVTAHGFRSAFRDWAAERTNFPREACEAALAHTIKDKAEAVYRRGDLLERRRDLMATWAAFVTSTLAEVGDAATQRGREQLATITWLEGERDALRVENAELRAVTATEERQKPLLRESERRRSS